MKMTISIEKERSSLYYLEGAKELQSEHDFIFQIVRETSNKENIIL